MHTVTAMVKEIRVLQVELKMDDAQLLRFAREISGTGRIRCLEDCLSVELWEILEELRGMAAPALVSAA